MSHLACWVVSKCPSACCLCCLGVCQLKPLWRWHHLYAYQHVCCIFQQLQHVHALSNPAAAVRAAREALTLHAVSALACSWCLPSTITCMHVLSTSGLLVQLVLCKCSSMRCWWAVHSVCILLFWVMSGHLGLDSMHRGSRACLTAYAQRCLAAAGLACNLLAVEPSWS
jgi:hypothetical protein